MSNRNNLGGDPSQWSNSRMTGVGLSIAGTVAGAMTSALVAAVTHRAPQRVFSAKAIRENAEKIHHLEMDVMTALLKYRVLEAKELRKRVAELEAAAVERLYRRR